jgi:ArsR family transcriptional regulator
MKNILNIAGAFNDETRILIVAFLVQNGECCVCELSHALNLGQSRLSRHLGILNDAGILKMRRDGKWVYYELDNSSTLARQFFEEIKSLSLDLPQKVSACEINKTVN